jgi:hypothetical protein
MKRDIFTFTINEGGREKLFILGIDRLQHILICSSKESALRLHDRMERKFGVDLKVLGLEGGTTENFEENVGASAPPGYTYKFLYEGTPEFSALLAVVRL